MKLHLYDFDGTLFGSPLPPPEYPHQINKWFQDPVSLAPPCVPESPTGEWWNPAVAPLAMRSINDPDVYAVLMTGRSGDHGGILYRVSEILTNGGYDFDEIHLKNSNTMELAQEISKKYRGIKVYPDASGSARSTTSNRSDHDILRNYPSHIDRLNSFNSKLLNSNGKVGMTVSARCKYLIRDMELVQRSKAGGIDKSDPSLTHALDSASYPVSYLFPVREPISTSIMA